MASPQIGNDAAQLGANLVVCGLCAPPPDDLEHSDLPLPINRHLAEGLLEHSLGRNPRVGIVGKRKAWRHDADDPGVAAVDEQLPANHGRVAAKPRAPEPIAQHHRRQLVSARIASHEVAAERGAHAQRRKERHRHAARCNRHGFIADARECGPVRRPEGCHRLEGPRLALPIEEVQQRDFDERIAARRIGFPHHNQTIRCRQAERTEDGGVDQRPRRRARGDAEAETQCRRCRRERPAHQRSRAERRTNDLEHVDLATSKFRGSGVPEFHGSTSNLGILEPRNRGTSNESPIPQ